MTPDDDFVMDTIGPIVLGVGFGGHGYKFGAVIGAMLADLVEGKAIPSPERFTYARFQGSPARV
jgi:sarcosine oxidase